MLPIEVVFIAFSHLEYDGGINKECKQGKPTPDLWGAMMSWSSFGSIWAIMGMQLAGQEGRFRSCLALLSDAREMVEGVVNKSPLEFEVRSSLGQYYR